jgi:hypothetical protein
MSAARKQILLKAEADRESTGATKDNAHAVKGTTQAWQDGADAPAT